MAIELLNCEQPEALWTGNENWLQYLYARLTTPTLKEFGNNAVSFITYNYDRTLEHFIHASLMNTTGKMRKSARRHSLTSVLFICMGDLDTCRGSATRILFHLHLKRSQRRYLTSVREKYASSMKTSKTETKSSMKPDAYYPKRAGFTLWALDMPCKTLIV
jgi:hypothetical protein